MVATAAGITVGQTTLEQFEAAHGRGLAVMGGHPCGARTWYDTTSGVLIYADAFCYTDDGAVVDTLRLEWKPEGKVAKDVPRIKLKADELGFLSRLKVGLSSRDVEIAMRSRITSNTIKAHGLVQYSERLVNKENDRFTTWQATFSFGEGRLSSVTVIGD